MYSYPNTGLVRTEGVRESDFSGECIKIRSANSASDLKLNYKNRTEKDFIWWDKLPKRYLVGPYKFTDVQLWLIVLYMCYDASRDMDRPIYEYFEESQIWFF